MICCYSYAIVTCVPDYWNKHEFSGFPFMPARTQQATGRLSESPASLACLASQPAKRHLGTSTCLPLDNARDIALHHWNMKKMKHRDHRLSSPRPLAMWLAKAMLEVPIVYLSGLAKSGIYFPLPKYGRTLSIKHKHKDQ